MFTVSPTWATERNLPLLPDVSGHLAVLEDVSAGLTLPDVLEPAQQARFRPVAGSDINLGYIRSAVWVRLSLPATTDADGVLSITPNFLDIVDIYASLPGKGADIRDYELAEAGDHRAPLRNGVSGLSDAVRIEFSAGEKTQVYIRILNTNSSTLAHFRLESIEEFGSKQTITGIAYGVWFGGMGILLIVQLVFFLFDRKPQYPLLALSTLFLALVYVGNLGLSRILLFPEKGWANDAFLGINAWANLCFSALAYLNLLDLRRKSCWLQRVYVFIAVAGVVGVVFAVLGRNIEFGPFGSVLSMVGVLLTAFLGLRYGREDGAASLLRAAAFSVVGLGGIMTLTQRLGFAWMPNWTWNAYGVSGLIQTVLLTGVLAVRLRDAEKRSNDMQAKMQSQLRQVRFLEVLSHQYRTPLSIIRASADSISFSLAKDDETNGKRIGLIRRSVEWLVQILEVNLERSLLQGSSFQPEPATITAGSIVMAAFQRALDLLNDPDIRLDMDDEAAEAVLLADAGMLELAILNLLENAVKYTTLKADAPITLSLTRTNQSIIITVADHGIGIPAADLPHVFESSVRGANAGGVEGSGLGLSLVARIVAAHSGTINLQSREGEGTTARLALPLAA